MGLDQCEGLEKYYNKEYREGFPRINVLNAGVISH